GSDSATINQTVGTYASANAGAEGVTATLTAGNYVAGGRTNLSNYVLPTVATGSGTITPKVLGTNPITATIVGATKMYDGTDAITLNNSNFTLTGFIGSDGATINTNIAGTFASANAGVQDISAQLSPTDFTANNGTYLPNYTLPTMAYGTGIITPAMLTASIINNPTKVYDGSTTAYLTPTDFSLTGFVGTQGITVLEVPGTYASSTAGAETVTASLPLLVYTPNAGTLLSNYTLPVTASGPGTITKAPLVITGVSATNITYNQGTVDPLNVSNAALYGLVSGDAVALNTNTAVGAFATSGAANNVAVTASGFNITGANALDYQLTQPAGLTANINPIVLTVQNVTANNKYYDGTTSETLSSGATLSSGVLSGDTVNLVTTGATASFGSVNVGNNLAVSAGGFSLSGAQATDYTLAQPSGLT
ncbi:MAG: YDG domain-containing protein, partial [Negativicutes bacterium]|nr:YDG domain-containing protein [Negativicutes bacterium]